MYNFVIFKGRQGVEKKAIVVHISVPNGRMLLLQAVMRTEKLPVRAFMEYTFSRGVSHFNGIALRRGLVVAIPSD